LQPQPFSKFDSLVVWLIVLLKNVSIGVTQRFASYKMFAGRLLRRFPSRRLSLHSSHRIIRSAMASQQYSDQVIVLPPLLPPDFQSTGFEVIDPSQIVEEERLPFYNRDYYYPMQISEVLKDRY